ncbi:hypothetical protein CAOG_000745 [Capsaspora owczarzaki ATCC 30864]|uniref:SnoaL-like domain-containing protein n=1 Tax=Capsaspora owczarzaki (strain ATCC 30864) TaxID=595528 RepID=A0A0D2VH30_CAPO3|nr:hypothetical protein CAOG_000745 [Capsaspora owczarzaki ATCC 30864]
MRQAILLTALLLACATTTFAANDPVLYNAIAAANKIFMSLFAQGNGAAIGQLYTPDAHLLPPGAPTIEGQANIGNFFAGAHASGVAQAVFDIVEVGYLHGDALAYERSNYTFYSSTGSVLDVGKYVVIWRNVTGHMYLYTGE